MRRQAIVLALGALIAPGATARDAHTLLARGQTLEQEGKLDEASSAYEDALKLAPRMAVAHDRLGFVRGRQGRTAEALDAFRRAAALDPALFDAHYHLGATLWWTKDPAGAAAALQRARSEEHTSELQSL